MAEICYECGSMDIVEDRREGDTICRHCGLVLSERNIETTVFYNPTFFEDHEVYNVPLKEHKRMIDETLEQCIVHLNLSDIIKEESSKLYDRIKENGGNFRGENLYGIIGGTIYISCNKFASRGIRNSKEIYEPLGVDITIFNKCLRWIYKLLPDVQQSMTIVHEDDTLMRQIRKVLIDTEYSIVSSIYKDVINLDKKRKERRILIGSTPYIINCVMIYIACEKNGLKLNKKEYVQVSKISRATLDKHYEKMREIF